MNNNNHSSYQPSMPQGMYGGYPSNVHHQGGPPHHPHHIQSQSHPHSQSHGHHSMSYGPGQPHQLPHHQHGSPSPHTPPHQPPLSQPLGHMAPHHPQMQSQHHAGDFSAQMVPHGQPGRPLIVSSSPAPPGMAQFIPQHQYNPHHHHHHHSLHQHHHQSSSQGIRHTGIPTPPPMVSHAPPPPPSSMHVPPSEPPPPSMHVPSFHNPSPSMLQMAEEIENRFRNRINATPPKQAPENIPQQQQTLFVPPPDSPYTPVQEQEGEILHFRPPRWMVEMLESGDNNSNRNPIPKLPWYSAPGRPFPPPLVPRKKKTTSKTRKESTPQPPSSLTEPSRPVDKSSGPTREEPPPDVSAPKEKSSTESAPPNSTGSIPITPSSVETSNSIETSNNKTTSEATPVAPSITSPLSSHVATPTKAPIAIPAVPIIPAVPLPRSSKPQQQQKGNDASQPQSTPAQPTSTSTSDVPATNVETTAGGDGGSSTGEALAAGEAETTQTPSPSAPAPPKSWADLVRVKNAKAAQPNGTSATPGSAVAKVASAANGKPAGLADLLSSYEVPSDVDELAPFLEPRGLINTGNMCFMNAIFQGLLFCAPFYLFLDKIGKNVAHSFKSETPLTDAMIMFIREFRVLESRQTGKDRKPGLEPGLAGDPFVPEFVYEVLKGLKRFSSMRRGHQQDAEEFLGFLLDGLHEESVNAMRIGTVENANGTSKEGEKVSSKGSSEQDDSSGWLEVGHKQKTSVTRTVHHVAGESPITKIFGGSLRSELRISGQKNSVTREPYQALQLDIQPSHINNIIDALRHLTTPESLSGGEFKSSRGSTASVTKQVFIETLPPVLILHLKRFQYDNTGGTQKVYKTIGYPLEFEVPREVISPSRRQQTGSSKYRLIGVVYHHGKSASGGHYTVDVRRQDGWIRFDDTIVKRVGEDAVQVDTPAPSSTRRDNNKNEQDDNGGWEEVSNSIKPTLTNGTFSPSASSSYSSKDDKVAYILFFERV